MTLPTYNIPPLTPHKPTPTIPQMEDLHERDTLTYKALGWLHWATCWIGGIVFTAFFATLLFRAIVGVY
jgi:hypothetical protein